MKPERLLTEMLTEWELSPTDEAIRGVASIVQPVTDRDRRRLVLKVVTIEPETRGEIPALQVWKGRGAVELMRADPRRGVLLLERLDRSLTEEPTEEAYAEIARLFGVLHRPASPKLPSSYALVAGWLADLEGLGRGVPAPPRFVEQALRAGLHLIAGGPTHVIHGDLHDGNVMWRSRTEEWVVIDPKGFNGDPCYEPATMLWNRWDELEWSGNPGEAIRDRFYALVDGAGLDERRSRDWVVVRAMINVAWAVLDARREHRALTDADHTWITRNITLAKAMQDVRAGPTRRGIMPKRRRHRKATPQPTPGAPGPAYHTATTPLDVARLLALLLDADRPETIVVLTVDEEASGPYASPADLATAIDGRAQVWFLSEARLTYGLTDGLPSKEFSAYNGAVRIYPPGTAWLAGPHRAPLLLAQTEERRASLVADVVSELVRLGPGPPTPPLSLHDRPNDSTLTWVDDPRLAAELGRELLSPDRTRPVVVITVAAQETRPFVDPEAVAGELHGIAPVFVLPTGAVTWAMSDLLPGGTDVYGGASRVYPLGDAWRADPYRSPLRFATSVEEGSGVADQLVADALGMAAAGGYREDVAAGLPEVSGVVLGISAGRALIRLDNGDNASVWPELVVPGIPARQVFRKAQRLTGRVDPQHGRLDLTDSLRTSEEALAEVQVDDLVLARAAYVDREVCVLELFPGFQVEARREDIVQGPNAIDLRRFLSEGEILRVQVTERGETEEDWQLTALVDEGLMPAPAPALLPGGPPWLVPVRDAEADWIEPPPKQRQPRREARGEPETGTRAEAPAPQADSALRQQLVDARAENARLLTELRERQSELNQFRQREQRAKKQLREANNTIARLRRESSDGRDALAMWEAYAGQFDPVDRLRLDIDRAWAHRFVEGDRPLAAWTVGPHFIRSWNEVEGISPAKVVDVLVEVLTGLDAEQPSRELHQLRTGNGGNDPVVTRADGSTAWRVSLQVKTPSARRLHYWRLPDGSVEFSSVRVHDDFRP